MLVEVQRCCNQCLAQAYAPSVMLPEYLLTLSKPVNCRLTMSSEQQAHSYTQYSTSSLHISPSVTQTNMKKKSNVVNFVGLPALNFGSYIMLYKARAVLMDSLVIMNDYIFSYGT